MTVTKVFDSDYIRGELSARVVEKWKQASASFPAFLPVTEESEQKENERRLNESMERLQKQFQAFPNRKGFFGINGFLGRQKRWRKNTLLILDEILQGEPLLSVGDGISGEMLAAFEKEALVFLRRAKAFAPELPLEDLGQALRNYMVYGIFRELCGLPQKCTQASFGYSMLYPFTDNFIDGPERTGEEKRRYNRLIADRLRARPCEAASHYEEQTLQLLDAVTKDFVPGDEISQGLLLMLSAQQESRKQEDEKEALTEEQALAISVYKGGLSVLIDRYLVKAPMTRKDLDFYYGFGFLLQLCDDLQDITKDRENKSRTVFSLSRSFQETEEKIHRLLHFTRDLFMDSECADQRFKRFLYEYCCLLILFSALGSREHVSAEWAVWASRRLPVTMEYMDRLQEGLLRESSDRAAGKYGEMMEVLLGKEAGR